MSAINPNELAKFKWILEVRPAGTTWAFTRLASVRWLVANIDTTNIIDVKADDTGSVFKVVDTQATIEAELLENMWRDTLALLFTGTTSDVAWTPVVVTNEAHGTWWTVWIPFKLNNKNWANTQVTITTIKANSTTLADWTDYDTYVWDGTNGDLGYTYIVPLTAQTLAITANYTYTPNASENITIAIDSVEVKSFEVKITATSGGKVRTTNLSNAAFSSAYGMSYADIVEQWDITWATLTFTANKWSTLVYSDEIL